MTGLRLSTSVLLAAFFTSAASRVEAGCAVPGLDVWSPLGAPPVPLNARLTVTLGQINYVGLRLELRPSQGRAVPVTRRELPASLEEVFQLVPDAPLAPRTQYELVNVFGEGSQPRELVLASFVTGNATDHVAPTLRITSARYFEQMTEYGFIDGGLELEPSARDVGREAAGLLFAVWLPDGFGVLNLERAPDLHLPLSPDGRLRLSSLGLCMAHPVILPPLGKRASIGVAVLDEANNRSAIEQVSIDFARPVLMPRFGSW